MALVLPRSIFLHIPKTGGTWVRTAIDNAGIPNRESNRADPVALAAHHSNMHTTTDRGPWSFTFRRRPWTWHQSGGRFLFTFVRNPLQWYSSYWAYRMETEWKADHPLDTDCASNNFEEFLGKVLDQHPAYVTYLYEVYVGSEEGTLGYVGRQENLNEDLIEALHRAGEKFREEDIVQTKPANKAGTSEKWIDQCKYSADLEEAVVRSEHRIMKRFGYI